VTGKSQCPTGSRTDAASSRLYFSWSGQSCLMKRSSSGFAVVATVEFLNEW